MFPRHWSYQIILIGVLFVAGLLTSSQSASATPTILGEWRTAYPQSTSSNPARCQLCHVSPNGGNGWNAYGWSLRQRIVDQGMTAVQAFAAVEALDADNNGKTNLQEITANFQPGWRNGASNTIYFTNGITQTNQLPPAAVGRPDFALANPITSTIVSTGSLQIALTTLVTDFVAPLMGTAIASQPQFLFVVDQPGQIWKVELATGTKTLFLDVATQLVPLGVFGEGTFDERGLLGLAFHPSYANNGILYTYQSEPLSGTADFSTMPISPTANHQSVIAQWTVSNPASAQSVVDPASKKVFLRIDQPQFNHDGGHIAFGADGLLYIALGDGGGADDTDGQPFIGGPVVGHGTIGNGQNTNNPLGSILRIDPLGSNSVNGKYGIPASNPFAAGGDTRLGEIYAYGLRNPYRFSFDSQTSQLYAADVGQNQIEEVNLIVAGGNYGWKHKEGTFYFDDNGTSAGFVTDIAPAGVPTDTIDPLAQYDHDEGLSVTGGFVYRGTQIDYLKGRYIFGDWSLSFGAPLGRLFYLTAENSIREFKLKEGQPFGLFLNGFGQDANGELYVLGNTTGTPFPNAEGKRTGTVLRITAAPYRALLPFVARQ